MVVGIAHTYAVVLVELAGQHNGVGEGEAGLEVVLEPVAVAHERSGVAHEGAVLVVMTADTLGFIVVLVVLGAVHPGTPGFHRGGGAQVCAGVDSGDVFAFFGGEVVIVILTGLALTVNVLEVRRGQQHIGREAGLEVYGEGFVLAGGSLGGDDDGAVSGLGTVEGGSRGTFQHRDALDVLGVDIGSTVTIVDGKGAALTSGIGRRGGVVHRNAVHHEEGRIVFKVGR